MTTHNFSEALVDKYNAIAGVIVAGLTAIFGIYWYIFAAYLVLNIADWLTGWYKSRRRGEESSKVGIKGAAKKLGYWAIILMAFMISYVFTHLGTDLLGVDLSFLSMIGWFTLTMLLVNEARSILENLVECGYNVPEFLIKGLAVAQKLLNKRIGTEDEEDTADAEE